MPATATPVLKRPRPAPPRRITVAAVREALRAVADEEPDRVDRRAVDFLPARYIDGGRPNCFVALVLTRLGFSVGVLRALDEEHPTGELIHAGVRVAESRHPALKKLDPVARQLLQYVQDCQDRGERWGRIVNDALTPNKWFGQLWDRRHRPWLTS